MKTGALTAVLALAAAGAWAQGTTPATPPAQRPAQRERAPRETVTATLDGAKVTVEYGRPSLNGRTLDQLLTQLDKTRVWRAGANQVTTLDVVGGVTIGGTKVAAGKYSLYLFLPEGGGDWNLIVNTDPGIALKKIYAAAPPEVADALWPRLDGYDKIAATEVARIPLKKAPAPSAPMDRFLIGLSPKSKEGVSAITFTWGDQSWTADIKAAK
jgi:hypothetical protein